MSRNVKTAKTMLDKYGIKAIKPGQLQRASHQLNKSLAETLKVIAFLKSGSQGLGPFPYTTRALRKEFL